MQEYSGSLIVLEGSDGSGKGTQFRLLADRLEAVGYDVERFDFPRYEEPSSYFVRRYLNGDYGPASGVGPYTASFFYALDRYEAAPKIRQALQQGKVVICNRYTGSNMAHQGSKFINPAEQRGFFVWADSLEYQLLGIPRPKINIFLKVSAEISYKLIAQKAVRSYTDKSHDEHEMDINHLHTSVATYDLLCQLFPKDFTSIDCTENGKMLAIPAISNKIWAAIKPSLPQTPQNRPRSKTVNLSEVSAIESSHKAIIPSAEIRKAPLSYEVTLKDLSGLAERVLAGGSQIFVQKQVSKAKLDLAPSYFYPKEFRTGVAQEYKIELRKIEKKRLELVGALRSYMKTASARLSGPADASISYALLGLDPLAKLSTIAIQADETDLVNLAENLSANNLSESKAIAGSLLAQLKIRQLDFNKTTTINYDSKKMLSQLIEILPPSQETNEEVHLSSVWPKNEFDILADLLYSESNSTREHLSEALSTWSFSQKTEALNGFLDLADQNLKNSLRSAHYRWDYVSSGVDMLEMLSSSGWRNVRIQPATPQYGYDIPELIEQAGLEEEYSECFDVSLGMYSKLQAAGHYHEAQYAVLAGHKVRWQADIDGLSLSFILQTTKEPLVSKSMRALISAMYEAAMLHHPILYSFRRNQSAAEQRKADLISRANKITKTISPNEPRAVTKQAAPKRRRRGRPRSKK